MQDLMTRLQHLRRPRILMKAARIGAGDYKRSVHLTRILGTSGAPQSESVLIRLMDAEESLNDQRLSEDAAYDMLRHVDVLIALVAEAQNWAEARDAAA